MTDASGHTTTYAHDAAGKMTTRTDAMGGDLVWTFDALGNRTTQRNRTDDGPAVSVTWSAQDRAADELINSPAFVVGAASRAITPKITADLGADGRWEMAVSVLSAGCDEIGSVALDGGLSLIQVDAAGSITSDGDHGRRCGLRPSHRRADQVAMPLTSLLTASRVPPGPTPPAPTPVPQSPRARASPVGHLAARQSIPAMTHAGFRLALACLLALVVGGCIGHPPWRGLWAENRTDRDLSLILDFGVPVLLPAGESGWVEAGDVDMPRKVAVVESDDCEVVATVAWDGRSDATLLVMSTGTAVESGLPGGDLDNVLTVAGPGCR